MQSWKNNQDRRLLGITTTPEQTRQLGMDLARCLRSGDTVLLSGDLGAGKTQFVQGVAAGLGCGAVPTSPTFAIVQSYGDGRLPLHHFDLYRLESPEALEDIGLREYLEGDGACFVEWAEKFPCSFDDCLVVTIEKNGEDARTLEVRAQGPQSNRLLEAWVAVSDANPLSDEGEDGFFGGGVRKPSPTCATSFGDFDPAAPVALCFDTANEVVALGLGVLDGATRTVHPLATREIAAHRASNTTLVPAIDRLLREAGVVRDRLACVAVGQGPGSFTGVRIAMATAKGIAQSRGLSLVGLSTLDAVAWGAWSAGVRGSLLVVADAMRKEVYPADFSLEDQGILRQGADFVVKADEFAQTLASGPGAIAGDGLVKYLDLFASKRQVLPENLWTCTGLGLLCALQARWREGDDILDGSRFAPAFALPVYTRLSDAEENERARLAAPGKKNLVSGVQSLQDTAFTTRWTPHGAAPKQGAVLDSVAFRPFEAAHAQAAAALEQQVMGSDAWTAPQFCDELGQRDRLWWAALQGHRLVGYAGALAIDGEVQVLKIAVDPAFRRQGIARRLFGLLVEDGRNLGCERVYLEVRASNDGAHAFYGGLGLEKTAVRPCYYRDREDAHIMTGPLPATEGDVAGMALQHHENVPVAADPATPPLIFALESSCDETAAAVVDGTGRLRSDVVASQIDFHARFGGVVPEIASRKHIEAVCGVAEEALAAAGCCWIDLDAVAVTTEPGLLGALVVGVAFAKGAAWALDVPLVGVNHLEGHLYANKIGHPDFHPPAVASLVSGGNTLLVFMEDWGAYHVLGSTIDDAVGEAFDKVAKALGLGYPGGPVISRLAEQGRADAVAFPRALLHSHDYRFSLSGLKTAVINYIEGERRVGRQLNVPDIAASFQQAVIDVQVAKADAALAQTGAKFFCLGGGVAANPALRCAYQELCAKRGVCLVMPPLSSCGDNAGMIALVALDHFRAGKFLSLDVDAAAHADLDAPK